MLLSAGEYGSMLLSLDEGLASAATSVPVLVRARLSDTSCVISREPMPRSYRNCAAVAELVKNPLFSCTSCSFRSSREVEENTRRRSCGMTLWSLRKRNRASREVSAVDLHCQVGC